MKATAALYERMYMICFIDLIKAFAYNTFMILCSACISQNYRNYNGKCYINKKTYIIMHVIRGVIITLLIM